MIRARIESSFIRVVTGGAAAGAGEAAAIAVGETAPVAAGVGALPRALLTTGAGAAGGVDGRLAVDASDGALAAVADGEEEKPGCGTAAVPLALGGTDTPGFGCEADGFGRLLAMAVLDGASAEGGPTEASAPTPLVRLLAAYTLLAEEADDGLGGRGVVAVGVQGRPALGGAAAMAVPSG